MQPPKILQDWVPLWDSLDWRLGQTFYRKYGARSFGGGDVAYSIHSDGLQSRLAANLLLTQLRESGNTQGPIVVEELGFGAAFFAREFLEYFRDVCAANSLDYYQRLIYVAVEHHEKMVEDALRFGILSAHSDKVVLVVGDAINGERTKWFPQRADLPPQRHAFFLNYLLDALPATVVRTTGGKLENLMVRTELSTAAPDSHISRLFEKNDWSELIEEYHNLVMRTEFRPATNAPLPELAPNSADPVVHNFAGLLCLRECYSRMAPEGFLLTADFTPVLTNGLPVPVHFGRATGMGVNFAQIDRVAREMFNAQTAAIQNPQHLWWTMVLGPALKPGLMPVLESHKEEVLLNKVITVKELIAAGKFNSAIEAFRNELSANPRNWTMHFEYATFCLQKLSDYKTALVYAEQAATLNPLDAVVHYLLGLCRFANDNMDDAEVAWQKAYDLGETARSLTGLAEIELKRKKHATALEYITQALIADKRCEFHHRILQVQSQILQAITERNELRKMQLKDRWL